MIINALQTNQLVVSSEIILEKANFFRVFPKY